MGAKKLVPLFSTYTTVYDWIKESVDLSTKRFIGLQGGTSSSKTYSTLQVLCELAIEKKRVISVVASTSNSLEKGAIRDFKKLLSDSNILRACIVNPKLVRGPYEFKNGSIIEFIHPKNLDDAKHGKREILYLNEINHLDKDICDTLIVKTSERVFFDYNSDHKFWVHTDLLEDRKDEVDFFISNYQHNEYVPKEVVKDLLRYKRKWQESGDRTLFVRWKKSGNPRDFKKWDATSSSYWRNKWHVLGCGATGIIEGVIFPNINWIHLLPLNLNKRAYCLDFGFANSPTAISLCGWKNNKIYGKELLYETGLTAPDIIKKLEEFGLTKNKRGRKGDLIIADSSNLDAITQIRRKGYNIHAISKPPNSVIPSVDGLRGMDINLTSDSLNWEEEQSLYKFKKINGVYTNNPVRLHDHLFDGLRYWYMYFFPAVKKSDKKRSGKRKTRIIKKTA